MSIRDEIKARIDDKRLSLLRPVFDSDPVVRTMVISNDIKALIEGPWADASWERRCNRLRADLEAFVIGDVLAVCLTPYEADSAYLGRLNKAEDEVWDIRARDPNPALRVFGRFAERDTFVALFWSPRSVEIPYSQRLPLGAGDSIQWKSAVRECKAEWRKLFHTYNPVHGDTPDVYVSNSFLV